MWLYIHTGMRFEKTFEEEKCTGWKLNRWNQNDFISTVGRWDRCIATFSWSLSNSTILGMGKDWAQRTNILSPVDYKYNCCAICDDHNRFSYEVKIPLQPAILQLHRHLLDLILWTTVWRATKLIDRWRHLCFDMVAPSINWFRRPSNCSSEYEIQQMALQL